LGNARKVAVIPEKLYCYRQQQGSVMHQSYSLKRLDAVDAKLCRLQYISEHYPTLTGEARISLLFTCLYHGQLTLKHLKKADQLQAFCHLQDVLTRCGRPVREDLKTLSFTHKCWLRLAHVNFTLCCRLRNYLRVGF